MKIGFIGTGVMGAPMATHLARGGYDVHVYNRTHSKAEALEPECTSHKTIKDAVQDADVIFTIVGMVEDVRSVYLDEDGIIASSKEGAILVDMTTSSPKLAEEIYQEASKKGLSALDCPVTGGDKGARNATLTIMGGGDEDVFEKVRPLLELMGNNIIYMGQAGSGQHAKMANQISVATSLIGFVESLAYARENSLDLEKVVKIINGGAGASFQSKDLAENILEGDYTPGFYVKHIIKDLKLAYEGKNDTELPLLKASLDVFSKLEGTEHMENSGTSAVAEVYKKQGSVLNED